MKDPKTYQFGDVTLSKFQDSFRDQISKIGDVADFRTFRPSVAYSDDTHVKVTGSAAVPSRFYISGKMYEITNDLFCATDLSGLSGLRSGLTIAVNTFYYLYAIAANSTVQLLLDTADPSQGPLGFTDWTYLCAISTKPASTNLIRFRSTNGTYQGQASLGSVSHTGDTTLTSVNIRMPSTAKTVIGTVYIQGATAGQFAYVKGWNDGGTDGDGELQQIVASRTGEYYVHVPMEVPGVIWLKTTNAGNTAGFIPFGWIEVPWEYK